MARLAGATGLPAGDYPRRALKSLKSALRACRSPMTNEYLAEVMAHGPPLADDEYSAIELLADLVGARIVSTSTR